MRLNLEEIVSAVNGTLVPGKVMPEGALAAVSTDSRTIGQGALFVCVPGETFDGHDFAEKAVQAGAGAILARHNPFADALPPVPVVLVENTVAALGRLANAWRHRLGAGTRVVGITGTAGKTTVKELLAQVLGGKGKTAKNPMNLNNQIGLPLSMLGAEGDEDFWVMEAGISHPQDMDELGAILQPDIALILNVGAGHTEGLGDRGTAHYKAQLLKYLAPQGLAIISADYPELVREARAILPGPVFFSCTGRQVEYRSSYVSASGNGKGLFRLWLDGRSMDVEAPFQGVYGAENIVAVAAVAHQLGLSAEEIAAGLATAVRPVQRFSCSRVGNWDVIDDTYNANPLSFARMLEAASQMALDKKFFACVLGEMGELGSLAHDEHVNLGKRIAEVGPDIVLWKGGFAEAVQEGMGRSADIFAAIENADDMLAALRLLPAWESGGVVLFKGSRLNRLEKMVRAFVDSQKENGAAGTGDNDAV